MKPWLWNAPTSGLGLSIAKSRWSVVTPFMGVPMPMAGLPGSKAKVSVGPPYSPNGASPRLVRLVRTMFPLCPFVIPPDPPVPIRLYVPVTLLELVPAISLADEPRALPATIVSCRMTAPPM